MRHARAAGEKGVRKKQKPRGRRGNVREEGKDDGERCEVSISVQQ